jgi:flagellar biosynthesis/type III secretory pathway protein FliH
MKALRSNPSPTKKEKREGGREGGRKEGKKEGREGGRKGGREEGRKEGHLIPFTIIYSKWVTNINLKYKCIKLLGDNIGQNRADFDLETKFLTF